jgi:hypothetical protein
MMFRDKSLKREHRLARFWQAMARKQKLASSGIKFIKSGSRWGLGFYGLF